MTILQQLLGTDLPAFAAASMMELPAGTETSTPSIVRVTLGPSRGGVPTSTFSRSSRNSDHMTGDFLLSQYAAKRLRITSIRLLANSYWPLSMEFGKKAPAEESKSIQSALSRLACFAGSHPVFSKSTIFVQ